MKPLTSEEYAAQVMALAESATSFVPTAHFDPRHDCIEFLSSPDSYRGERLDDVFTVFRRRQDNQIIGFLIKGVRRLCEDICGRNKSFMVFIKDGPVKLDYLVVAYTMSSPPEVVATRGQTYRELADLAEGVIVEGDLCSA